MMRRIVHRVSPVKAQRRSRAFDSKLVVQLLSLKDPQAFVLARNDCAENFSGMHRRAGKVIDSVLRHHKAEVLAIIVNVKDVFAPSPNHVLFYEEMIDGLCQVSLDLDKLFSLASEAMNGLPTSNEDLVLRHLHHHGADLSPQRRRLPLKLHLSLFEVEDLQHTRVITHCYFLLLLLADRQDLQSARLERPALQQVKAVQLDVHLTSP
mmetsp:Transcript_59816/g.142804  ORF Transcript_59816/g.142804 Transcript_59816/m.142804 type:complete len:208 (-) Transcript_59816:55-678(-)